MLSTCRADECASARQVFIHLSIKSDMFRITLPLLLLFFSLEYAGAQNRYYVDAQAIGLNNGLNWSDAFTNLHDALIAADSGDEIWVAQGTYKPSSSGDRNARFQPASGVRLLGGFSGTEMLAEERDPVAHPVVLSGDIGVEGDSLDNSYNLMYLAFPDVETLIDGLTFKNALANKTMINFGDVGVSGAALYVMARNGAGYPTLRRCVFEDNTAQGPGGAVYADGTGSGSVAPLFEDCLFKNNRSTSASGGAIYRNGGSWLERPNDVNRCRFERNYAFFCGASIYFRDSDRIDSFEVNHTVFYDNHARFQADGLCIGGLRSVDRSYLRVRNCLFEQNKHTGAIHTDQFDSAGILDLLVDSCMFNKQTSLTEFGNEQPQIYVSRQESHKTIRHCAFVNCHNTPLLGWETNFLLLGSTLLVQNVQVISPKTCTILNADYRINIIVENFAVLNGDNLYVFYRNGNDPSSDIEFAFRNILVFNNHSMTFASLSSDVDFSITNGTFVQNEVLKDFDLGEDSPQIYNSVFQGNVDTLGQPISTVFNYHYDYIQYHNCLTDGDTIRSSLVNDQSIWYHTQAQFVDAVNGDFRLAPCSPGVDAGLNTAVAGLATDISGAARIQNDTVDMGAYESPTFGPAQPALIHPACTDSKGGGLEVFPTNGCEPYQYQWNPFVGNGPELTDLPPGEYALTVTDSRGRSFSDTLSVPLAPSPQLEPFATDVVCGTLLGGTATVAVNSGTPPFVFEWSTGAADSLLTMLPPGQYKVTVIDAAGCVDSTRMFVLLNGQLTLIVDGQPISCLGQADGALSAQAANGKAPFTYAWSNAAQDSSLTNLAPGQYIVTVTDVYGCTASFTFNLDDPPLLLAFASAQPTNSEQTPNGSALAGAGGGTPPHTYAWSTGEATPQIQNLQAGVYTVTVTDAHDCTATATVEVLLVVRTVDPQKTTTVKVWPNPAREWLYVETDTDADGRFLLYDALGRLVALAEVHGGTASLDVSKLPAGVYEWRCAGSAGKVVLNE
ncbi:MAG: hypothetical protein JNJ57_10615 [Saprospiraceae bacterium]|nr:hypothetical protein [Saprospiraceae bacterium]